MILVLLTFSMTPFHSLSFPISSDSLTNIHSNAGDPFSSTIEYRSFDQVHFTVQESGRDPIVIHQNEIEDSIVYHRSKALEYNQEVTRRHALIGNLNDLSLVELPVGLTSQNDELNYTVIISQVRVTPRGAFLEAYLLLELPQTGDKIAFRGTNIQFSHKGGLARTGRLELLGSYPVKINGQTLLTILGNGKTFAEFDCNGFQGLGLEAEVEFSRDLIVPEDDHGTLVPAPNRVQTHISTYAQSWNDLLVSVSLPPFQVNGLDGVGFSANEVYLDWSDLANPPGLLFPPDYATPFMKPGTPSLWQGLFLQHLEVRLPPSFASKTNPDARVSFGAENLILDEQGLTGSVFTGNILETGTMNGWDYSIEKVSLDLLTSQVKGFQIEGTLSVPVLKTSDGNPSEFGYVAHRGADGNYLFAVKVDDEMRLPLFLADLRLDPGSSVMVKEREHIFYPTARLNGELSIDILGKGPKAQLNSIRFEDMVISSESPHFRPGTFALGSEQESSSVAGYPVVINHITVTSKESSAALGFDLSLNLGGKPDDEGFSGTTSLTVWGKKRVANAIAEGYASEREGWEFDKVKLEGVGINIRRPGIVELAGMVRFFSDDPVYGEGFRGSVKGKLQVIAVEAVALFGKTPSFRYWFADGLVELRHGVPLAPGLSAYGFGGGYYSNMKQGTETSASTGKSPSGISYVPDEDTRGIKAIVILGTAGRPEPFNGDVMLEVVLNGHGGINSVSFRGNARFMTGPLEGLQGRIENLAQSVGNPGAADKLMNLAQGQVYGNVLMVYDRVNHVFHANLEIYVNVAGGLVRGVSPRSKAGWATIHFSNEEWYILIGTPDQPIGLEVARLFKSEAYFMVGQHLPGSPPPPPQVAEILGGVDLDYMRDLNALESGNAFAFGLHFIVDTGNLRFLMFYGRFSAGTGFDIMLKDYGEAAHCLGQSEPLGINGWYANGQAYAFVMGKVGIRVNLTFYKGDFDILSIGAAALLQVKGPNPFWMQGTVGGYYRILGGLVKGRCRFQITVGDDCKPVGEQNLLEEVRMIADISPTNGNIDVNVFNAPQVAFNIPVNEVFDITDLDGDGHSFRAVLEEFTLQDQDGPIQGILKWNSDKDLVAFSSKDALPGEQKLTAHAELIFQEFIAGAWQPVRFKGQIVKETAETSFTTGKAPGYIPQNNVALSYPLRGQINFYPLEYAYGFIQLRVGQPYLFNRAEGWNQIVRFSDPITGVRIEVSLNYDETSNRIAFNIPVDLTNSKVYRFDILNIPIQTFIVDENVRQMTTQLGDAGAVTLTTQEISGELTRQEERIMYGSFFRTSQYDRFLAKMKDIKLGPTSRVDLDINVFRLAAYMNGIESWDAAEATGTMEAEPLIQMEAVLKDNKWYNNHAYPLVYADYPLFGNIRINSRNVDILGIPPVRDIHFDNYHPERALLPEDETYPSRPFKFEYVAYDVGRSAYNDYRSILHQAVNLIADTPSLINPRVESLILDPAPVIRYGKYRFKIEYVIPGKNNVSSTYEWELFNRIPDND